jgi:hypothetical protein
LHHLVEFAAYQVQAFLYVVRIAAEIDTPDACVAVTHHRAFYSVDQSVALAE